MISQKIKDYVKLPYEITIECESTPEGKCYLALHPELKGCMAQGNTAEEAINNLKEAKILYIDSLLERGLEVPLPKAIVYTPIRKSENIFVVNAIPLGGTLLVPQFQTMSMVSVATFGENSTQNHSYSILHTVKA